VPILDSGAGVGVQFYMKNNGIQLLLDITHKNINLTVHYQFSLDQSMEYPIEKNVTLSLHL
jgi:hypothetical protein